MNLFEKFENWWMTKHPIAWLVFNSGEQDIFTIPFVELFCEICKENKPHTQHGFRHSNYRLECTKCGGKTYYEYE